MRAALPDLVEVAGARRFRRRLDHPGHVRRRPGIGDVRGRHPPPLCRRRRGGVVDRSPDVRAARIPRPRPPPAGGSAPSSATARTTLPHRRGTRRRDGQCGPLHGGRCPGGLSDRLPRPPVRAGSVTRAAGAAGVHARRIHSRPGHGAGHRAGDGSGEPRGHVRHLALLPDRRDARRSGRSGPRRGGRPAGQPMRRRRSRG